MAEYIDRDEAIALAKDIIVPTKSGHDYRHRCIDPQDLAELPAADVVERKTGKWVKISPAGIYECNQCGQNVMTADIEAYKFCHGCGAKMEGVRNDV